MFSYKAVLETAQEIIERQKKALAAKSIIAAQNEKRQEEVQSLRGTVNALNKKVAHLERKNADADERHSSSLKHWVTKCENADARLENIEKFFRWAPEANEMHLDYLSEQRKEALRKAAEQKRLAQELEQKAQREREEQQRLEAEQARQFEAQQQEKEQERERQRVEYLERRSRGMGMGR